MRPSFFPTTTPNWDVLPGNEVPSVTSWPDSAQPLLGTRKAWLQYLGLTGVSLMT